MAPMEKARQAFFAQKRKCAKTMPSSEDYIRAKFLIRKGKYAPLSFKKA